MVSSEPYVGPDPGPDLRSERSARSGIPQNVAAERAVVGAILAEEGVLQRIIPILLPADFIDPRHRLLYTASLDLWDRGETIDPVTAAAELARKGWIDEVGGQPYITQLVTELPTTVGAEHYARVVQRAATYRDMLRAAGDIGELAYRADPNVDASLSEAVEKLYSVRGAEQRRDFSILQDLLVDVLQETADPAADASGPTRTGFGDLDRLLNGGIHASDLLVLAARPAVGKSALALTVARNAALGQGAAVAMFSLEMSAEQVAARLVSAESGVENNRLRVGQHTDEQQADISRAIGLLSRAEIYIDDTAGQTLAEIRAKSRNLHKRLLEQHSRRDDDHSQPRGGLGLIIVDHIQLVHAWSRTPVETNRVAELSVISRTLKEIARELHVPVLAISQLSRAVERRKPPVPMLSDLRESGSIEQDADVVVFIYRADMYKRDEFEDEIVVDPAHGPSQGQVAQLLIAKHRHGAVGTVDVRFVPQVARFEDFFMQEEPPGGGWEEPPDGAGGGNGYA